MEKHSKVAAEKPKCLQEDKSHPTIEKKEMGVALGISISIRSGFEAENVKIVPESLVNC